QSDNATQIVPSPDGKWVAFAERWHLYLAAFPRTGRPVDLGPAVKGYPVAQISRDAGMYIQWSGDGSRVHWALGPEYFTRDLSKTFAFLSAGGEGQSPAQPESTGVPIGFTAKADKPGGSTIALVGARIITMAGSGPGGVIDNGTVVVKDNRIEAIGSNLSVPSGAKRFVVKGKTIMPGMVDVPAKVGG
ncbi:MAG: amidohydrolase, partial [Acidobacteriota bacterium]